MAGSSSSSSEDSVYEVWDPCKGRCPGLLVFGVVLLGFLKLVMVAPFTLGILWAGAAVTIGLALVASCVGNVTLILMGLFELFRRHCKCPKGPALYCSICRYILALPLILLHPFVSAFMAALVVLFGAPLFAVSKPVMDTWTAWKYGQVWYLPDAVWWYVARLIEDSWTLAPDAVWVSGARRQMLNGTLGVLAEACVLASRSGCLLLLLHFAFAQNVYAGCPERRTKRQGRCCIACNMVSMDCVTDKNGNYLCKSCAGPEDVAWESFVEELKEVGYAAMDRGLISAKECDDLEPFLILGLPGLVLLRSVTRTVPKAAYKTLGEGEDDDEDMEEAASKEFISFLSKAYREQGEGIVQHWGVDGNLYEFDESENKAVTAWKDTKGCLEDAGFFDSSSEEDLQKKKCLDDAAFFDRCLEQWWLKALCGAAELRPRFSNYAILEAWILFGERPDVSGLRDQAKWFLSAYDDLQQNEKSTINIAASKIRSFSLIISKTPTIQKRLMTTLSELGEVLEESACRRCCARFSSIYSMSWFYI